MNLRSDQRQNVQGELDFSSSPAGEAREVGREETESLSAVHEPESPASTNRLMEEICERENLKQALQQVKANKGSAGVDGMTVGGITDYLKQHWPAIREQLLSGTYEPKPVRRVALPKPVHFLHCCQTSCSTNSTVSWSVGDIAMFATRTTATSTFAASARVNG